MIQSTLTSFCYDYKNSSFASLLMKTIMHVANQRGFLFPLVYPMYLSLLKLFYIIDYENISWHFQTRLYNSHYKSVL